MSPDTLTCSTVQARISDADRDGVVDDHLRDCDDCSHFAATLEVVCNLAPETGPAMPTDLTDRLHRALDAADDEPTTVVPHRSRRGWIAGLAAVAAAAVLAVAGLQLAGTNPQPASELAAAAQDSATTPTSFTFSGVIQVSRHVPAQPSAHRDERGGRTPGGAEVLLAAAEPTFEVPTLPEVDDEVLSPDLDFDVPEFDVPDLDVTIPPPTLPDLTVELRADLARLGIEWTPDRTMAEVRYRGHGRSSGDGRLAYELTLEADTGEREVIEVVTAGGETWVRPVGSRTWARTDEAVELRVGPLTVPHALTALLARVAEGAERARPVDHGADGQRRTYAMPGPRGRMVARLAAGAVGIERVQWTGSTTADAGLRVVARLNVELTADAQAQVDVPATAVPLDDLPLEDRPALLAPEEPSA